MADPEGALILYGRGGDLGDFKPFVETLKKELQPKYGASIESRSTEWQATFFDAIKEPRSFKLKELHIFSHSIGAGLFLGYQHPIIQTHRNMTLAHATAAGRKVTHAEVVLAELGAVLTDHLVEPAILAGIAAYRAAFAKDAFIKIWGCNSAVKDWVYSDGDVTDQNDASETYYWRALNLLNVPKPSVAQAFADFFGVPVYGAGSGANISVKHQGKWISSKAYKDKHGKWPSGSLPHRLVPTKGNYREFQPAAAAAAP